MNPTAAASFPSGASVAAPAQVWAIRERRLSLDRPLIMGVLNVTPDSFSDGGRYLDADDALREAVRMAADGADLIDVGGESTRPGAQPVSATEELDRVLPVVRLLKSHLPHPISIDTRRAEVAAAALDAGTDVVNDISALSDPGMADVVRQAGAGLVLMHMRGTPETMQIDPRYGDVVLEVGAELDHARSRAREQGIADDHIVLDPGIGFGKTAEHNLQLLNRLDELVASGRPVLVGPSRKAFLGILLGGRPPGERGVGTAAACVAALERGARIFRVHDVDLVRQALDVAEAIRRAALPVS